MGVHGLWRLIEPSGKPVPLETLENKVLAVDVSIWLHQAIKGFQDAKGASVPNAHLLGIYHRLCKLLYFKVKPVFVFDGGVPALKVQTMIKRNQQKLKNNTDAKKIQKKILDTLLKHTAVNKVLSEKTKATLPISPTKPTAKTNDDDLFKLPPSQLDVESSDDEDYTSTSYTDETTSDSSPCKHWDLQSIDPKSSQFKSLPADVRHEILTDLKETRKQNSWGRLHELPTQSDEFSGFQMNRLLKRNSVQVSLEEAEKEMGGHSLSLGELESLLNDHGVITDNEIADKIGGRIASDENTRFLYIKDVKKALEKARIESDKLATVDESTEINMEEDLFQKSLDKARIESDKLATVDESTKINMEEDLFQKDLEKAIQISENQTTSQISKDATKKFLFKDEFQRDIDEAIKLSLENEPSTSKIIEDYSSLDYFKEADFNSDSSEEEEEIPKDKHSTISAVKNYMLEYGGLTQSGIEQIFGDISKQSKKNAKKFKKSNQLKEIMGLEPDQIINDISENFKEIKSKDTNKIEFISSSDSESSTEFLEVVSANKLDIKLPDKKIEIIIQPQDNLEDDIFSDIFCDNKIISNIENKDPCDLTKNANDEKVKINPVKVDLPIESTKIEIPTILEKCKPNVEAVEIVPIPNPIIKEKVDDKVLENEKNKKIIQEMIQPVLKGISKDVTTEDLKQIESNLLQEKSQLITEKSTKERHAGNISDIMYQEAQELLELFGVPYIIAPMEAEAQCAFLDEINLVDGTITDDSDIWLFGGRTVYRNFFNQKKHVCEFKSDDIQHHFKLSREQLILLALLVGSDYTSGIQGVGPVTALEILAAFPNSKANNIRMPHQELISGMKEFKSWFNKGKIAGPGRAALRTKLKNIEFTENFPSIQVIQGYLQPKVETSKDKFSWGKPNAIALIDYAKIKFGWSRSKSEEILKPVLKRLEETKSQTTIKDFFKSKHKINNVDLQDRMSKRVKKAINKMGKDTNEISSDEDVEVLKKARKVSKKKVKEIDENAKKQLKDASDKPKEKLKRPNLHTREFIHQKEMDKSQLMKSKLKAIEVFRKSVKGPGFMKKRVKTVRKPKDDAELSESSSN